MVPFSRSIETSQATFLYPLIHFYLGHAVMDVNDTFAQRLPVAVVNHTAGFNVHKMREARAIRRPWLMSVHMQGVEGESVQLSRVVAPHNERT